MSTAPDPSYSDSALRTLEDCVKAQRDLWAFCRNCGHAKRVRTKALVLKLNFVSLARAARALRCVSCQQRASILLPDRKWPDRN